MLSISAQFEVFRSLYTSHGSVCIFYLVSMEMVYYRSPFRDSSENAIIIAQVVVSNVVDATCSLKEWLLVPRLTIAC